MAKKESTGADVFQILRNDHENVSSILNQLKLADEQQKQELFEQVRNELDSHMTVEEKYFYSRLEDIEELADVIQDCLADHDDIRQILQQMNDQDIGSEEWESSCQSLEDTKDDHVDLEEQEVFPQAIEMIDGNELNQIAEQITAEKNRIAQAPQQRRPQKRPPTARA